MKTTFLIILTLTSTALFGQKFSIGSEIGVVSSSYNHYKITDFEVRRNTYYSGVNLHYNYNERISFTTGIHYLRQGHMLQEMESRETVLADKMEYLAVPVTVNLPLFQSPKLITTLGFLGAINIAAEQYYIDISGGAIHYPEDFTPYINHFTLSSITGLGYKFFENEKLEFIPMVKYYQGLTNTFNYNRLEYFRTNSSALLTFNFHYKL